MADDPREAIARQLQQHLEALQAAGIEYVPVQSLMALVPAEPPPAAPEPVPPAAPPTPAAAPAPPAPVGELFAEPAAAVPESADDRRRELAVLADRVSTCDRCPQLYATRNTTVFGVGPVDPEVCFIGEAPGADEDATGEPFVGKAGQLLNKILAACGFKREDVYICNTLKCRPPGNRTPTPDERANCRGYFDRQLALVRPNYIVCLGATAAQNVLGTMQGIGKLRGRMHQYRGIPVMCTFHPAALLRNESWKKDVWEDMKALLRHMGRPVPGAKG